MLVTTHFLCYFWDDRNPPKKLQLARAGVLTGLYSLKCRTDGSLSHLKPSVFQLQDIPAAAFFVGGVEPDDFFITSVLFL